MKRAVISWGGWTGHEPEQCAQVAESILRDEGYDVEVYPDLDVFADRNKMAGMDLVVPVWTMGDITPDQEQGLLETVRSGAGIAGWHGGMADSFRTNTDYQWMVGGQWVAHPGNIVEYEVNITRPDDPVVAGIKDFKVKSEQYYMHTDPGNEVLATTTFSGDCGGAYWIAGTVMPVVWKRMYGDGRVFYSSLGHVAADFDMFEIKEIMRRGMIWATR